MDVGVNGTVGLPVSGWPVLTVSLRVPQRSTSGEHSAQPAAQGCTEVLTGLEGQKESIVLVPDPELMSFW